VKQKSLKTRVVIIGSAAEYGVVNIAENPIRESRLLAPVSVYGLSKSWQSQLIGLYRSAGLDVLGARVFNLYGCGISDLLFAGRVQNQIRDVLDGKKESIEVGQLTAVRDYISTEDAAIQLLAIIQRGLPGEIYHVASGVPVTMQEILQRQLTAVGLSFSIVKESAQFSNRSGYDVPMIYADISKTLEIMNNNISRY
jgi:GDP-4-dehydro-6-deoxy-D-mannose reductase